METTLLLLQPTPFCNLDCRYCYLPDRSSQRRMSTEVACAAASSVEASGLNRGNLEVVWHSGEPLSLPIAYFREIFEALRRAQPPERPYRFGLQTNGLGVTDAFCELFCDFDVQVGISIDGPAGLHDFNRRTRNGRGSHHLAMRGLERLQQWGLDPHVIAVVTARTLEDPHGFMDFFEQAGVSGLNLCFEEVDGTNLRSSLHAAHPDRFGRFIEVVYDRAQRHGRLYVRELADLLQRFLRPVGPLQLVTPFAAISVRWDGKFSTFSPELLGMQSTRHGDFLFGDVTQGPVMEALKNPKLLAVQQEIEAGITACQASCEYFGLCGGGVPSNKLGENGTFDSTVTANCRLAVQSLTDLVLRKYRAELAAGTFHRLHRLELM